MCGLLCGTFDTKETFLENYNTDECEESCVQIARQRALLPHIKGYRLRQGVIMSCVYLYLYSVCGLYVPLLIRRQRGLGVGWGELCCFSSFCQRQVARDRDIKWITYIYKDVQMMDTSHNHHSMGPTKTPSQNIWYEYHPHTHTHTHTNYT